MSIANKIKGFIDIVIALGCILALGILGLFGFDVDLHEDNEDY